ncbi:MAG: hypothetical protein PHW53_03090 [Patescibacteria group bacterium]|nr:hypothetical protein [Patescibacteria group bacterium]
MPLNISYSAEFEKRRIKNTIKKLSWYKKLGYSPCFPKNINPQNDNLKKIYAAFKNEYDEADYKRAAREINEKFSKIESTFYDKLEKICGKKIKRNFKLILTKYGVGGSYSSPNTIIFNIKWKFSNSVNIVLHEITHLVIEPHIKKYQVQHNEKERIVDLILTSKPIGLKNYKMQQRGEEYKKFFDPLFKKYFKPPIGSFFKKLARLHRNPSLPLPPACRQAGYKGRGPE